MLVIREIRLRYKETIVGVSWAIFQPLFMMWIFLIVFDKFSNLASEGIPYSIFCLAALIPWTFFTTSINIAIPSLVDNESLITKIYFPREFLPLSGIGVAMVDFLIASGFYIALLLFMKIHLNFIIIMVIPLFLIQLIFMVGVIFWGSALNVFYRDVKFIIPFVVQIGMFATPIVYSITMISDKYKLFYMLNPLACLIDSYRKVILEGTWPNPQYVLSALLVSGVVFILGYIYFKRMEGFFADAL